MKRLEDGKRNQVRADIISVLKARIKDGALPKKETPVEVRRFNDEARAALEEDGYKIYTLTGQSVASLREAGREILSVDSSKYVYNFDTLTSRLSEVAINPDRLILPNTDNKTLVQQEKMIKQFSIELGKKIPGVEAIMGGAPNYTDLACTHLDATDESQFGENYIYDSAISKTPTVNVLVALVGSFHFYPDPDGGMLTLHWRSVLGWPYDFVVPLVVPKA